MRVYVPATLPALITLWDAGGLGPKPLRGFAVTPTLREWYAAGDLDELEYAAMSDAARASLRLLCQDPTAPRRRVVVAADVPDDFVSWAAGTDRAAVLVDATLPLATIAAVHVDAKDADADIATAVAAMPAADDGDEDAQFAVDGAEGHELMWYATQEIPHLVADIES
jgi:hypothetical protein